MKRSELGILCLIVLVATLAGCGVDWFPEVKRTATTPNTFRFTTRVGVPILAPYSSNAVTITGFANSSTASPVTISTGSKYSIDGATPTDVASTIKNNQTIKVFQTNTASLPGGSTVSTLNIGGTPGTFTTVTQTIAIPPTFTLLSSTNFPGFLEIYALITTAVDTGGHTITMPSTNTNTQFAVSDSTNTIFKVNFTSSTAAITVDLLTNQRLLLLVPASGASATTTLIIDNTRYVINNTAPFTVTSFPL